MTRKKINRRLALKWSAGSLGALGVSGLITNCKLQNGDSALNGDPEACQKTSSNVEGPFYPESPEDRPDVDLDLVTVNGAPQKALGREVLIEVTVELDCQKAEGLLVEFWQACRDGVYDHPNDPQRTQHPDKFDPFFQYYGKAFTDRDGKVKLRTIQPGAYPANSSWIRASHIHFKVHQPNGKVLTSQMFFPASDAEIFDAEMLEDYPEYLKLWRKEGAAALGRKIQEDDRLFQGALTFEEVEGVGPVPKFRLVVRV